MTADLALAACPARRPTRTGRRGRRPAAAAMSVWNVGPGLAQIERVEVVARLLLAHPPRDVVVAVDQAGHVRPAASPGRAAWRLSGSVVIWARGRAVPARVIATAVARRNGGRIASVCTTKVVAGAVSAAPWPVPEGRALVTSARRARHIPRAIAGARTDSRRGRSSGPTAFPRVCVGGNGPFGGSDDEDSAGQSRVGRWPSWRVSPPVRARRVCRPASSPAPSRRTTACRCPGATITVESPALQGTQSAVTDVNGIYVVRGLPPGRVHRHHRDGRHGDRQAADARAARSHHRGGRRRWRRRRSPSRSPCAPKPRPSSPTRPSAPTSTAKLINELPTGRTPFNDRRARARPDRQQPERRPGHDRAARSPTTTSS